jgi:hypothetical protein
MGTLSCHNQNVFFLLAGNKTISPSQLEDNEHTTGSTSGYFSKKTDSLDDAEGHVYKDVLFNLVSCLKLF